MIAYSYIRRNLRSLDYRYQHAKTTRDANYHSKLAILELCGWLETAIDEAVLRTGSRILRSSAAQDFLAEKVKRTYGFEYERHLKSLIVALVGISGFERIEKSMDIGVLLNFKSELEALKIRRNSLAHTYTKGATVFYDAPSITLARLSNCEAGIREYDTRLRAIFP